MVPVTLRGRRGRRANEAASVDEYISAMKRVLARSPENPHANFPANFHASFHPNSQRAVRGATRAPFDACVDACFAACVATSVLFFGACAASPSQTTIRALVPDGTPVVYVAGSVPELGSWDPSKVTMEGTGRERVLRFTPASDAREIEFKLTLGSWSREALGADGNIMQNQRVERDGEAHVVVAGFREDRAEEARANPEGGGVLGTLIRWDNVFSKHLVRSRTVEVWLPPEYDANGAVRHPVIYAHDGQNMFDPRLAAFGVDWGLDEAIVARDAEASDSEANPLPIVVAIWNTADRRREYNPWDLGDAYARFLIEELKPRVDAEFRTRTDAATTMTLGSSMGGLISFHLCRTRPDVFGLGACVSTHVPFHAGNLARAQGREPEAGAKGEQDETPLILRDIAAGMTFPKGPRLWFDYGTVGLDAAYEPVQREVDAWLVKQGLVAGVDFVSRRYDGADHSERAWRARVGDALAFLLPTPRIPSPRIRFPRDRSQDASGAQRAADSSSKLPQNVP
jgi:enterochelin esterase-like enzyme